MTAKRTASLSAGDLKGEFGLAAFMGGKFCPDDCIHPPIAASLLPKRLFVFGEPTRF
jgi:hypothetical protein